MTSATATRPTANPVPPGAPSPARTRIFRPADTAALTAVAALVGMIVSPSWVSAILVGTFVFLGPGSALATWVPIPRPARPAAIPTLSIAMVTLATIIAMWSYRWNPVGILVLGAIATLASSGYHYHRHDAWPRPRSWWVSLRGLASQWRFTALVSPPALLIWASVVIWAIAMPSLPGVEASFYGLLASGSGVLLIPAMLAATVGFVWAVATGRFATGVCGVGAAIVVGRMTTWVGTEVPLYDWTYKHLGIVRYIQEHHLITPDGTDIYAQWPAFFVTAAWFSDVTGLDTMTVAHLFAPLIHVLIAVIVYSAARVLRQPPMTALVAAFLIEIINWVGQDYFSPQAWTLVLAFGLLVMLLSSRGAPKTAVLAIIPFAAMVPTHQLTPFWVIGAAALLVIFRQIRPWWVIAMMMIIVGCYLALNYETVAPYGLFSSGNPVANATSNITSSGVPAKEFTSLICRGLSGAVFVIAAGCAVWQWRRRQRWVVARLLLAFCAVGLLLGQSYGGEAIFRVYLYSLLGCTLLIAPVFTDLLTRRGRARRTGIAAGATAMCAAALAGLFSFLALWPLITETRSQVTLMSSLVESSPPGTRFTTLMAAGLPTRSVANYAPLTLANAYWDGPIELEYGNDPYLFPSDRDIGYLNWMAQESPTPTYVLFSEQSHRKMEYYGIYARGADLRFKEILRNAGSAGWQLVYDDGQTTIFRHNGGKR